MTTVTINGYEFHHETLEFQSIKLATIGRDQSEVKLDCDNGVIEYFHHYVYDADVKFHSWEDYWTMYQFATLYETYSFQGYVINKLYQVVDRATEIQLIKFIKYMEDYPTIGINIRAAAINKLRNYTAKIFKSSEFCSYDAKRPADFCCQHGYGAVLEMFMTCSKSHCCKHRKIYPTELITAYADIKSNIKQHLPILKLETRQIIYPLKLPAAEI